MTARERREAIHALKVYPRLQRRMKEPKITPEYGGVVVQHSASRTTENVALSSALTEEEENIVAAVDFAIQMQAHNHNAAERLKMVDLKYIRNTHTLDGVALEIGYSSDAVKKWNAELLTAVYVGLKKK